MNNTVSTYVRNITVKKRFDELLQDKAPQFMTSLMSTINSNPLLQECTPESVVVSAIKAASLDLPIDQNLGFAYLIPYNNKKKTKTIVNDKDGKLIEKWSETSQYECQFQIGWKGFVQLAIRSGMFHRINVTDVVEGEYVGIDRRSGDVTINWDNDNASRSKKKVVGYLAYFRLVNGLEKDLYMTVGDLDAHAKRYSQTYKKGYGKWVDDKPAMSKKTVLKLLISRYGALSTSLREAIKADQSVLGDDTYDYIDNKPVDKGLDNIQEMPLTATDQ